MDIRITDYPELRLLAWNRADDACIPGEEALALYERNWRHVDHAHLTPGEQGFIDYLVKTYGNGVFNV